MARLAFRTYMLERRPAIMLRIEYGKSTEKLSEERKGRCDNPNQPHLKQLHHTVCMYKYMQRAGYDSASDLIPLDFNCELMSICLRGVASSHMAM